MYNNRISVRVKLGQGQDRCKVDHDVKFCKLALKGEGKYFCPKEVEAMLKAAR
jgi:hypothetical protein